MNAVNTKNAEYIGNELIIDGPNLELPEGWELPTTITLCSAHRRQRGVYLGRTWYLQCAGLTPKNTIDMVSFDGVLNDENLARAQAFLTAHGYRCTDEFNGDYSL